MSETKFLSVLTDNVIRTNIDGTNPQGCGGSKTIFVGDVGTKRYRTYIKFDLDWTDVGRIISAKIVGYTKVAGVTPRVGLRRLGTAFADGNNADGTFDFSDYTAPTTLTTGAKTVNPSKVLDAQSEFDITDFMGLWAPPTVIKASGGPGEGAPNHGIALRPVSGKAYAWQGYSNHDTNALFHPKIELVYELGRVAPNPPDSMAPSGDVASFDSFAGDFTSIKTTAKLKSAAVEVYVGTATNIGQVVTGLRLWTASEVASESETIAARFHIPSTGFDPRAGTPYKWRSRVTDMEGQTSEWSDLLAFTLTNTPPDAPVITPADGIFDSLNGVLWRGGTFSDGDGDTLKSYQLQLALLDPDSVLWDDPSALLWDTGRRYAALGSTSWESGYGGKSLLTGTYVLRGRQWDSREGISDWAYTSVSLTEDFVATGGSQTSVQQDPRAPWRVVLRTLDSQRGPGDVVAVLENAKSLGASINYNAAGEMHMTLPIDHPQVHVIEPKLTHYEVQFYTGDGWRGPFYGLITNMQPNDTSVIFFGIDYLGLFNANLDERFDADNPDLPAESGGSKYVAETVTDIVTAQLQRNIDLPNSPLGFITIGTIEDMPEVVTIWSTMRPTLDFVVGLINSHREGTGKNTRISVDRNSDGSFSVNVVDDPGVLRDNLELRYGELVQGYEFVPFGPTWGTVQHGIGRTREGLKVLYHTEEAPGISAEHWGRWANVAVYENVSDDNDLLRRVKQAALEAGKVGNGVAIGLRTGWLQPLDGYDVCDHIPIHIVHGVVDTTKYGSGYWTVFGVTWEAGDDGSEATNPILRPRTDDTPPAEALLPKPTVLSPQQEWQ